MIKKLLIFFVISRCEIVKNKENLIIFNKQGAIALEDLEEKVDEFHCLE